MFVWVRDAQRQVFVLCSAGHAWMSTIDWCWRTCRCGLWFGKWMWTMEEDVKPCGWCVVCSRWSQMDWRCVGEWQQLCLRWELNQPRRHENQLFVCHLAFQNGASRCETQVRPFSRQTAKYTRGLIELNTQGWMLCWRRRLWRFSGVRRQPHRIQILPHIRMTAVDMLSGQTPPA